MSTEYNPHMNNLLEVWADSEDFMDKILHADDAELAEIFLNDVVAGYGCSVASNLKFFYSFKNVENKQGSWYFLNSSVRCGIVVVTATQ